MNAAAANSENRLKVLVSNDDGIHAEGILTLVEWLAKKYDVFIFAPEREQSAMGHALTLHTPIRVKEVDYEIPGVVAHAVNGTPSDCVKMATNAILDFKPDILVSGINHGPNLGIDVLYSGTVSAAIEGAINGIPSVAISLSNGGTKYSDFIPSAEFITNYLPRVLDIDLPQSTILNINTPAVPLAEMTGVRLTELGRRMYTDTYEKRVDPRGNVYYWLAGEIAEESESETSDVQAIRDNAVSITPVHFNMTHTRALANTQLTQHLTVQGSLQDIVAI